MSSAYKCDRCGGLYDEAVGAVSIDQLFVTTAPAKDKSANGDSWEQIDLCPTCGPIVIEALGGALK